MVKVVQSSVRRRRLNATTLISTAALLLVSSMSFAGGHHEFQRADPVNWNPRSRSLRKMPRCETLKTEETWQEIQYVSMNPEEVCKKVRGRVRYARDRSRDDEWKNGSDTWSNGEGDCEDFAAAVSELCCRNNINVQVYVFSSKTARAAHAVIIGNHNGDMWMSSNGSYERIQSLFDAQDRVARDLGWYFPEICAYKVENMNDNSKRRYKKVKVCS